MVFIEIPLSQPNAELQCHFTIYNLKYNNKYICIYFFFFIFFFYIVHITKAK